MLIGITIVVGLLVMCAVYLLVSYFIASGVTKVGEAQPVDSPIDYGVKHESVKFRSRRGDVILDGWLLLGRKGMPVVIFAHGIGVGRTGDGHTELAAMLNRRGFGVLTFDFRAHGSSGGSRVSSGWHERMDVLGAYDYLLSLGVKPSDIGLLGISMGAAAVSLAAADESRIGAVALDSPYARASELMVRETALRIRLPEWFIMAFVPCAILLARFLYDIKVENMDPERAISQLRYPVMVIHGVEDSRIPPEQSRRLFDASADGSLLWVVEDIEHAESFLKNKSKYADRIALYFLSRLCSE